MCIRVLLCSAIQNYDNLYVDNYAYTACLLVRMSRNFPVRFLLHYLIKDNFIVVRDSINIRFVLSVMGKLVSYCQLWVSWSVIVSYG